MWFLCTFLRTPSCIKHTCTSVRHLLSPFYLWRSNSVISCGPLEGALSTAVPRSSWLPGSAQLAHLLICHFPILTASFCFFKAFTSPPQENNEKPVLFRNVQIDYTSFSIILFFFFLPPSGKIAFCKHKWSTSCILHYLQCCTHRWLDVPEVPGTQCYTTLHHT